MAKHAWGRPGAQGAHRMTIFRRKSDQPDGSFMILGGQAPCEGLVNCSENQPRLGKLPFGPGIWVSLHVRLDQVVKNHQKHAQSTYLDEYLQF